jgi:hypothetical protein
LFAPEVARQRGFDQDVQTPGQTGWSVGG